MKQLKDRFSVQSARVNLSLKYPDFEDMFLDLSLNMEGPHLYCRIETGSSVTISLDTETEHRMTLFNDEQERFITQKVKLREIGTREAFSQALRETQIVTHDFLFEQILDIICSFARSVKKYVESDHFQW
jgi:hypothetical protein